ncbi:unnamed protein product [Didymodactylos carnosus]|uniref:Tc1-like transposase DDE domain-containing protein n=1 Tax=Didymodactylos carnosus TaxID=1234261 RepID=A0A8S2UZS0_9BILA|nr:unnamed protein product [Didymodactylos carnosus]
MTTCPNCSQTTKDHLAEVYSSNPSLILTNIINRNLRDIIKYQSDARFHKEKCGADIVAQTVYQSVLKQEQTLFVTCILRADGAPITKRIRNCKSMWILQLFIAELSPYIRFSKSNIMLLSIWTGSSKEGFNLFLCDIVKKLNSVRGGQVRPFRSPSQVQKDGLLINIDQTQRIIPIRFQLFTGDLPALETMTNTVQHGGYHACISCNIHVFYWIKSINLTGAIDLEGSKDSPRVIRTKAFIQKVKQRLSKRKRSSIRLLAKEMKTSFGTIHRTIKDDLSYKAYKMRVVPKLADEHKSKRKSFGICVRKNITKSMSKKILFSDEKYFRVNNTFNTQNDRMYAATRKEADDIGGIHRETQFSPGIMIWLGVCYQGVTRPVIIEGTINSSRYIEEILPIAFEDGEKMLGSDFIFQQDGAPAHRDQMTQQWCEENFPDYWTKDRWPPYSPDLNPLDYCIWDELRQQMDWSLITNKQTLMKK